MQLSASRAATQRATCRHLGHKTTPRQLQSSISQLDALEISGMNDLILFQGAEILLLQFLLAGWPGQMGLLKQQ